MKKYLIEESTLNKMVTEGAKRLLEDIAGIPSGNGFNFQEYINTFMKPNGTDRTSFQELMDSGYLDGRIESDDAYDFLSNMDGDIEFAYCSNGDAYCTDPEISQTIYDNLGEDELDNFNFAIADWYEANAEGREQDWRDHEEGMEADDWGDKRRHPEL